MERIKPWQWKPGQSGNPSGRPKRRVLKEIVDDFYNPATPEGRERLEQFVIAAHNQMLAGSVGGQDAPNPDKVREWLHAVLDGPMPKVLAGPDGEDGKPTGLQIVAQLVLHEGEAGK